MGIAPLVFTGISQFSDDFQTILSRAVAIASIPLQQVQYEQADLLTKKQLLGNLRTAVADMASSLTALGNIGQNQGLSATTSNANRVAVSLTGTAAPGVYTVSNITSVASAASETTLTGYATSDQTQVATTGTLQLVVGSNTYDITLAEGQNNLAGLRDAINALGAGVNATVLNTGTGDDPYFLSLTATSSGATTLQLLDSPGEPASNLLSSSNQGSNAVFKLNGLDVTRSDNVVSDAIPGVTFTIVSTTSEGESVTLSLASNRAGLASELTNFVARYNAVASQVNAQIGTAAGLLSGDFIIRQVQGSLRALTTYQGSGSIKSLFSLGIELSQTGVMSFNSQKFYSLSNSEISAAFSFLGSPTSGLGGLSASFTQISDPVTGLIKTQQDQYDIADQRLSKQLTSLTERIQSMQSSLSLRLQQADALLAQLESQQSMLEASMRGLELLLYGKKDSY